MAYYQVSNFWIDTATGNMWVQFTEDIDVSYPTYENAGGQDFYEAQLYLDGQVAKIGAVRPESEDGTIAGGTFGRTAYVSPENSVPFDESQVPN
jgi:hypothetical protein